MASEKEKMISERMYYSFGPELLGERMAARKLCEEFNRTTGELMAPDCGYSFGCRGTLHIVPICISIVYSHSDQKGLSSPAMIPWRTGDDLEKRSEILNRLFHGKMDMSEPAFIEPPFTADYVSVSRESFP